MRDRQTDIPVADSLDVLLNNKENAVQFFIGIIINAISNQSTQIVILYYSSYFPVL